MDSDEIKKYKKLSEGLSKLGKPVKKQTPQPKKDLGFLNNLAGFKKKVVIPLPPKIQEKVIEKKVYTGKPGEKGPKGDRGERGPTGKDGKDGRDGKNGIDGKDSASDTADQIVNKLNTLEGVIEAKVIKDLPSLNPKDFKLGGKHQLELRDIKGARLDMGDQRWHGGGISNITGLIQAGTNVTITGSGTATDPYIINSSGGGGSQTPWTSNINGGEFNLTNVQYAKMEQLQLLDVPSTFKATLLPNASMSADQTFYMPNQVGTSTLATLTDVGDKVPYTGASQSVDLSSSYNLDAGNLNSYGVVNIHASSADPVKFFQLTGTPTGGRTITIQDADGTLAFLSDLPTALTLQTNGTPNGSQTLLNLVAGTNVTLTDNGTGSVTIDATGGGGSGTVTNVASADGSITVTNPTTTVDLAVIKATTGFTVSGGALVAGTSVVNGTSTLAIGGVSGVNQTQGTDLTTASNTLAMFNATAGTQAEFQFYRSKNAAIGSATVVANNDGLGKITWYGAQQTGTFANQNPAAQIRAEVDAGVTSGAGADMPGRIVFSTTPNASGTPTDRLILDSTGVFKPNANDGVALGTATLSYSDLFLASGAVIGWNNSNVVLTHTAGILTIGTGTLKITTPTNNTTSVVTIDATQTLTGKTYNGLTVSTTTGTFTLTNAKTLSVTNTLTLSGTDSTTMTFPTTTATIARTDAAQTFTGTQTFSQVITTANAITAVANAATVPVTSKNNIVTNNSAATLTITLTTASAVNMQDCIIQVLDFSAAAQTLTFVNTENSTVSVPATTNGSTTLPLTIGFKYNSATSKWRCVAYS